MSLDTQAIEQLISRVDQLESRASLRDLVTDYCQGFDNHDWDQFISIWHEDAVWEIGPPFGTFYGHDGIRQAVRVDQTGVVPVGAVHDKGESVRLELVFVGSDVGIPFV